MALERGKLQDLVFDNRLLWSHRALAAFFGAILKLPPVKRLLGHRAGPVALPGGAAPALRLSAAAQAGAPCRCCTLARWAATFTSTTAMWSTSQE